MKQTKPVPEFRSLCLFASVCSNFKPGASLEELARPCLDSSRACRNVSLCLPSRVTHALSRRNPGDQVNLIFKFHATEYRRKAMRHVTLESGRRAHAFVRTGLNVFLMRDTRTRHMATNRHRGNGNVASESTHGHS